MSSGDAEPGDDRAKIVISFGHRGDIYGDQHSIYMPEQLALFTAVAVYSKAFLEALARRHADGLADVVRKRLRENYKNTEAEIGLDSDKAATVVVTGDLPDEARLALLDLDITADDLRGKVLRWDGSASAWRPADD
jgi:hypothetical protein